jgi:hypothetical protein
LKILNLNNNEYINIKHVEFANYLTVRSKYIDNEEDSSEECIQPAYFIAMSYANFVFKGIININRYLNNFKVKFN